MGVQVKKVHVPPNSVFIGRGDLSHAGASYEDSISSGGTSQIGLGSAKKDCHVVSNHLYLVPRGQKLLDSVHRNPSFTPHFQDGLSAESMSPQPGPHGNPEPSKEQSISSSSSEYHSSDSSGDSDS